ncbi:MAG: DPP IV N-terminal domain-containing protein, partial [Leadbetterella sp.]|nr:DPP IV N-terminal domain-containing protein [Leadbetterella sp.]
SRAFYEEQDEAWVDVRTSWAGSEGGWRWLKGNRDFLWISEKDGWNHIFRVSRDGKKETLITEGALDVISPLGVDETHGFVYYLASPGNATQRYLYRSRLDGNGSAERVTPAVLEGSHTYQLSPNGLFAVHGFSNYYTPPMTEAITLPDHQPIHPQRASWQNLTRGKRRSRMWNSLKWLQKTGWKWTAGWPSRKTLIRLRNTRWYSWYTVSRLRLP